jgi:hypothetical protein
LGLFLSRFYIRRAEGAGLLCAFLYPVLRLGRRPPDICKQAEICPGHVLIGVETAATRLDATRHNILRAKHLARFLQLLLRHACLGFLRIGLLLITSDLGLAGPTNSLQSLSQNGVAVVVSRVHPVGIHGRKVLDLELDEGRSEFGGVAELVGEGICAKG